MIKTVPAFAFAAMSLLWGSAAAAQAASGAAASHYDLNVYPAMGGGGPYDFTSASAQFGGPVVASSAQPKPSYSFADMLANTRGYISTGVSSRGGYDFEAGALIPIMPGKAELEVGGGTGQIAGLPTFDNTGKHATATYDTYYAALHVHPTDDIDATIAISGLRFHGPAYTPYGIP